MIDAIRRFVSVLWKEWPIGMDVRKLGDTEGDSSKYSLTGICPHCRSKAVFVIPTGFPCEEPLEGKPDWSRCSAAMQCQGCGKFILGVVLRKSIKLPQRDSRAPRYRREFMYEEHFPLDKPDDSVAEEIPAHIAADFREALRCRWVDAYNATAEMCRRAIEASCIAFGAKQKLSITQKIDWVYNQRRINKTLKEVAHKIRLGGNYAAHAPADPASNAPLTSDEADAVIEFTRHYLDHVYVVDKKLGKFDFSKAGRRAKAVAASAPLATPPVVS